MIIFKVVVEEGISSRLSGLLEKKSYSLLTIPLCLRTITSPEHLLLDIDL